MRTMRSAMPQRGLLGCALLCAAMLPAAQAEDACFDWCVRCSSQVCSPPPAPPPKPPPLPPRPQPPPSPPSPPPPPPMPPPPPLDCNTIVPLGSGSCSDSSPCEGCCTYVGRCRSHEYSTGGFDGCSGASFNSPPFKRCHWIGEHCVDGPKSLYGNIPYHCRTPPSPPSPPPPPPPPLPPPPPPMPPPPPLDCSTIVPLGSGSCSDSSPCEGCCTHLNRCRSHQHSTSGLAGCSGASFNSAPFPRCHWVGEYCKDGPRSLYGNPPAHCTIPTPPPAPPAPPLPPAPPPPSVPPPSVPAQVCGVSGQFGVQPSGCDCHAALCTLPPPPPLAATTSSDTTSSVSTNSSDKSDNSSETSDNTTVMIAAVGGAVGGLLLLAVVAGVAIVMKKRKTKITTPRKEEL